jgi:hypothetical protein
VATSGSTGRGTPVYDIYQIPDAPRPTDRGCNGIDFLFAIDNSGSMGAHQGHLLASFPEFISAIQTSLESVSSYHVGVVTSDDYLYNGLGCRTLGDLVTETADGSVCGPFAEGKRFATQEDDLEAVFPCIANVGTAGSGIEQPVTASIAAVSEGRQRGRCRGHRFHPLGRRQLRGVRRGEPEFDRVRGLVRRPRDQGEHLRAGLRSGVRVHGRDDPVHVRQLHSAGVTSVALGLPSGGGAR